MKCLVVLCFVTVQVFSSISETDNKLSHENNSRFKRYYNSRWHWRNYENSDAEWIPNHADRIPKIQSRTPEITEEPNPCDPVEPRPVPSFRAPNRRISQVKCYEYLYGIKVREETEKRRKTCAKLRETNSALGGRDALPGEFPHMGAIGFKAATGTWIFKCGGTLISAKYVLTAAHCAKASTRDASVADVVPKIVRLGDRNVIDIYDLQSGHFPVDANISNIINHPNYKSPKKYFDIALLELEDEVIFTKFIQPACLYTGPDYQIVGKNATITGWGVIATGGLITSPVLQAAVVDVLDSEMCDELLRPSCNRLWCGLRRHQLCAGILAGGVDACQGDSGGPLQINITLPSHIDAVMYYVIGVTSFGMRCAQKDLPGIYTRVSSFLDWIEDVVWNESYDYPYY